MKTIHVKKEQSATHYTDLTVTIANEVQGVLSKVKLKFVSGTVISFLPRLHSIARFISLASVGQRLQVEMI